MISIALIRFRSELLETTNGQMTSGLCSVSSCTVTTAAVAAAAATTTTVLLCSVQ